MADDFGADQAVPVALAVASDGDFKSIRRFAADIRAFFTNLPKRTLP